MADNSGRIDRHQSAAIEQIPAARAIWRKENADQFFANPLRADLRDRGGIPAQRFPRFRLDLEPKDGRETNRAQHAQTILRKTSFGIADCPDQSRLEVRAAANEIDHFLCSRIEEHSVNREIAPGRILFGSRKMDLGRSASVEISAIRAKGRDLKLKPAFQDNNHSEMRAHRISPRKNFLHRLRSGVGRDVDVLRRFASEEIAHTTAGEICDVPMIAQSRHHLMGDGFHFRRLSHKLDSVSRLKAWVSTS